MTAKARQHRIYPELKCLGCVDRWNKDERDPHQHAGALQHDRGHEKVGHARSTSNAVFTVKRAARACRKKWQLVQTSRGVHNSTMSSHHPEHGLIFQMKPKFAQLPTTPAANYRERSSERTPAQNTQWPSSSSPKHGSGRVGNGRKDGGIEMCP